MSRILSVSLLAAALADTRQHSSGGGSAVCPCEDAFEEDGLEDDEPPVDAFDALGRMAPIDNETTFDQLRNVLGAHQAALMQVRGDNQRFTERLQRILPEGQEALGAHQAGARAVWVPGGTDADVYARYLNEDGSVRLGRSETSYMLPNGAQITSVRHGLFTEPYPVTREAQRVREAYRRYAVAYAYARKISRDNPWTVTLLQRAYGSLRRSCEVMPGPVGVYFRKVFADPRAVSNTAGTGAELIAVPTLSDVRRPTDIARRLPGLFQNLDVPASTFKQPIITGYPLARKRGKTVSNDPAPFPVSTFTSSDVTLTVVDRVIQAMIDTLWATDAGLILPDPIGTILDWLEMGDTDSLTLAIMHGDTETSHQDAIATWTMGGRYAAGALNGSDSPLRFWGSLRSRAADDGAIVAGGGTFTLAKHVEALDHMGPLAGEAVMLTGLHGYYTQFVGSEELKTVSNVGDRATLNSGEVASYAGKPVVIEQLVPNDFDTTGLFTGSGATTIVQYVNPSRGTLAHHTGGEGDYDAMYPEKGARYLGMVRRSLFFWNCLDSEKPTATVINL